MVHDMGCFTGTEPDTDLCWALVREENRLVAEAVPAALAWYDFENEKEAKSKGKSKSGQEKEL